MMNMFVAVTRIVNSCVLIEIGGYAVLGDPWFRDRWYLRFGEQPGMRISELPKLAAIIGRPWRSLGQAPTSAKSESDWIHFVTPRHRRETTLRNRLWRSIESGAVVA